MGNFLSEEEIATYNRQGYVVPKYRLPADELARLQALTLEFVAENPQLQNKQVVCPHIPQKWVRDINVSEASALEWQKFARNPAILDMAESILGPDIIMWGSSLFYKQALKGAGTPWHRDARVPVTPLETCTVWIAVFDSKSDNGCVRFIPGSHSARQLGVHHLIPREDMAFESTVDSSEFDESTAQDVELEAGQMMLFDVFVIHGARLNEGARPRAGYALRYMPGTSHYHHDAPGPRHSGQHTRPLMLVRGEDKTGLNDFTRGHQPD